MDNISKYIIPKVILGWPEKQAAHGNDGNKSHLDGNKE